MVFETTSANPWQTSIIAKVAINGGSLRIATLKPLIAPSRPPNRIASRTPTATGICQVTMKVPAITAQNAIPVPTERSMPLVMITKVAPSAKSPTTTAEYRMLMMLP